MKARFFASVAVIKIMFAAIGCLSMIITNKSLLIRVLSYLEDLISQLCTLKEDSYLLLEEMMQKAFTQHVKNMTSKMILGVELLIWTLLEIQQHLVSSTTNTFTFSLEELNSIKRKLRTRSRCMISITICGEWLTWMQKVHGQLVTLQCVCQLILRIYWFSVDSIKLREPKNAFNLMLRPI